MINDKEIIRIKEAFKYLEKNEKSLNDSGWSFVRSLKKQFLKSKTLSERQIKALFEIQNNIN